MVYKPRSAGPGGARGGPRRKTTGKAGTGTGRRRYVARRKVCAFCADKTPTVDYKEASKLLKYISERGKILSRRRSGNCARHQRVLCTALKRARHLALLPYAATHAREIGVPAPRPESPPKSEPAPQLATPQPVTASMPEPVSQPTAAPASQAQAT